MLDIEAFRQINHVIEYDTTSSTYKFALLKNIIEACQKYDHLITENDETAEVPLGLVVEGWIFDYLPFVFERIRQQNARGRILNQKLENSYEELFESFGLSRTIHTWQEASTIIHHAYETLTLDTSQSEAFLKLAKESAATITLMPMRYIGIEEYGVFKPGRKSFGSIRLGENLKIDRSFFVNNFGTFRMRVSYYQIFRYLGQNLYGMSTIARRWKEKTCQVNPDLCLSDNTVEKMIFNTLYDRRDTNLVRNILPEYVKCVWSGKEFPKDKVDIDHMLPYSIWHNNDLWNLLPTDPKVNNKKRDKIPSPELIKSSQNSIIEYWSLYKQKMPEVFRYQVKTSLGSDADHMQSLITRVIEKADYLIYDRGLQDFSIN